MRRFTPDSFPEPDVVEEAQEPVPSDPEDDPVAHVTEEESGAGLDWAALTEHFEAGQRPTETFSPKADSDEGTSSEADEPVQQTRLDAGARSPSSPEVASQPPESIVADPERFFDYVYTLPLRQMILGIVETEGPMTLHRLARRVAQEHGWQRTGKRIQERVEKNLGRVEHHPEFGTTFVWAPRSHAERVAFRGLADRAIREVSRAEIASVIDVHATNLAQAEDSILVLSRLLGISRLSKDARTYLTECARWQVKSAAPGAN